MKINEVSKLYDISADTLRYYERIGLIPPVTRNESGIRDYSEADCNWVQFAKCMRGAGLSVESLIEYVTLFGEGDGCAVVLMLAGWLGRNYLAPWMAAFNTVAYVPLIWSLFRMYSRNIEARRRENAAFQRVLTQLKDRDHRYYHCPKCRQTVRVPRGRGKINIRCPKCGEQFIKKT